MYSHVTFSLIRSQYLEDVTIPYGSYRERYELETGPARVCQ
jgi:hypothetical protein